MDVAAICSLLCVFVALNVSLVAAQNDQHNVSCEDLLPGQFQCLPPMIDSKTQAAEGCTKERNVLVPCFPSPRTYCNGRLFDGNETREEAGFFRNVSCRHVGGKSYKTAVGLTFLGMFGVDRMYLGYPALGLLKMCTFGFFMLGQLVDMVLIAAQVVGPADGSDYYIDFYGPVTTNLRHNAETYPHMT
ncbi:TM2 domain-containing protein 1-like [Sycon ciliatum]|uniref:TM2 domain-containing protein 1-like n=1 Tax=Sycon ciliatum TaxID=27933 RepID=UPI0020AC0133|eukprot:scpid80141/ scgid30919/ TM2 domain-containing protein 1